MSFQVPAEVWVACNNAAQAHGVPLLLLLAISYVESRWNPSAMGDYDTFGKPHSYGLFQLYDRGAGAGYTVETLLDPFQNADIAARYLARAYEVFEGDYLSVIAAFNLGFAGVRRKGREAARAYVEKVLDIERRLEEEGYEVIGRPEDVPPRGCLALPLQIMLMAWRGIWKSRL
jgi:soluble lytic murein transglycosylase-like protein